MEVRRLPEDAGVARGRGPQTAESRGCPSPAWQDGGCAAHVTSDGQTLPRPGPSQASGLVVEVEKHVGPRLVET